MSCPKRTLDEQDPDYEDNRPNEAKRLRLLEENAKAGFSQKVSAVIQRQFSEEVAKKEKEAMEIQERLGAAQKTLHLLRYVVISSFYNRKPSQTQQSEQQQQKQIHPAVKKLIGKQPRFMAPDTLGPRPSRFRPPAGAADSTVAESEDADARTSERGQAGVSKGCSSDGAEEAKTVTETVTKVPRYIPPKKSEDNQIVVNAFRGNRHKVKKRFVIGNISKWVPVDTREDAASHKWMMYVRGAKESPDVSGYIAKVRFFLHPSYRPHDIVEITSSPFHLSRRGWGEFPVRVQIHFIHPLNKPVDVIHHLKLDRTYTGLQTLGAETVVDIWLHMAPALSATNVEDGPRPAAETCPGDVLGIKQASPLPNPDGASGSSIKKEVARPDSFVKHLDIDLLGTSDQTLDNVNQVLHENVPSSSSARTTNAKSRPCAEQNEDLDFSIFNPIDHVLPVPGKRKSQDVGNTVGPLSFDHDYFGSCVSNDLPDIVSEPFQEDEIKSVPSNVVDNEFVNNIGDPLGTSDCAIRIKGPREINGLSAQRVLDRISCDIKNEANTVMPPEKDVIIETIRKQLDEQSVGAVVKGTARNQNSATNKETVNSALKPMVASTLSKPTTLVKCMDKSGNVFYITLGGATAKSPLKTATISKTDDQVTAKTTNNGSSTGSVVVGGTKTVLAEARTSSPVSLLTTSLLAKPAKSVNHIIKGKICSVANPKPVMKSLINPKPLLLTQPNLSKSKPAVNNVNSLVATTKHSQLFGNSAVKNSAAGVSSEILKKLQIQGIKFNSKPVTPNLAGTMDYVADGTRPASNIKTEQARTSLLLKTNLNQKVTAPSVKVAMPLDASKKLQQTSPLKAGIGGTILTPPAQGQTLLLVKNGQFFLLKQPTAALNTVATKAADKTNPHAALPSTASGPADVANHPPRNPPNVSAVLNSLLQQSQSNSGAAVIKVNQPLGITRTYLNASKPGLSLLRKNVLAQPHLVPSIKMEVVEDGIKKEMDEKMAEDQRLLFSGRTLVLNKANSRMVVHPKKPKFEDALKAAVSACKFDSIDLAVTWLLKHLPLVSPLAAEPSFRTVHPYATASEAVFFQWNFGKRKAAEWQRARAVRQTLLGLDYDADRVWSTYNISLWSRLHGFTPLTHDGCSVQEHATRPETSSVSSSTFTEPVKILEWLDAKLEADRGSLEEDIEVDVVNVEAQPVRVKEEPVDPSEMTALEMSPAEETQCLFVRETARDLGINLQPEQIVPGVLHCAAEKMLLQAMKSLVDDLLRRSLRKACERSSSSQPDNIRMEDVRAAILDRPEFDILSNIGLGVQAADTG